MQIIDWDIINKILTVDVTLTNPFIVSGYDVRGILTNLGEKKLLNPDDYTKMFDSNFPPVANPFRAFGKDESNRKFWGKFSLPDQHIKTETYVIYFPNEISATYIVTASFPNNAPEPYDIVSIEQTGEINEVSGSIEVTVEVLDWQDVTAYEVIFEDNPVTGTDIGMTPIDATHWQATLTNDGGASAGDYEVWVAAYDEDYPFALYNKFIISVVPYTNDPPIVDSGVDGEAAPQHDAVELYTVTAHDDDGDTLTYSWTVTDSDTIVVLDDPDDLTGTLEVDWAALGAAPDDIFYIDCAVTDGYNPPVEAETLMVSIAKLPGEWGDPILVSVKPV